MAGKNYEVSVTVRGKTDKLKKDVDDTLKSMKASIKLQVSSFFEGLSGGVFGKGGGSGIGQMVGKLGLIAGVLSAISGPIKLIADLFVKSSPIFSRTLLILERAVLNFLRPIADLLGMYLRPMAIALLRISLAWRQFFKDPVGFLFGKDVVDKKTGQSQHVKGLFEKILEAAFGTAELGATLFSTTKKVILQWLTTSTFDIASWLYKSITATVTGWITGTKDLITWLFERVKHAVEMFFTNPLGAVTNLISWLADVAKNAILSFFGINSGSSSSKKTTTSQPVALPPYYSSSMNYSPYIKSSNAVGMAYVPETGAYMLHRGESVISAGSGNNGGKMVVQKITINMPNAKIAGNSDIDDIGKRISRSSEMYLRSKGLIR